MEGESQMRHIYGTFGTPIYFEGEGGGGGGGGGNPDPKPDPKPDPPKEKEKEPDTVPASVVQQRIEETRRKTEKDIAEALGVTIDEAKEIIKAKQDADEAEKSEAQKAREQADREKAEAEAAKSDSATTKHLANLERVILRALPNDMDDETTNKKVERISKIVDVAVGADLEAISAAVKALKEEDPSMFGAPATPPKKLPPSDPKGKPPTKGASTEDGWTKGQERAKALAGKSSRPAFDV